MSKSELELEKQPLEAPFFSVPEAVKQLVATCLSLQAKAHREIVVRLKY
jgi:hypothetical protein